MAEIKSVWQRINHEQEMYIGSNFLFDGREGNVEFFCKRDEDPFYYLSKNPNERFLLGISVSKISYDNKSIAITHTVFDTDNNYRFIKEREPLKVLERIMKHHPHKNIYEREMILLSNKKLKDQLESKPKSDTKKEKRIKV